MILGDSSLQKQAKHYRLKFDLTNKNRAYADHIIELLDGYVIGEPHIKERATGVNVGFQTISHIEFDQFGDLFIKDGKKSAPKGLIKDHLTPRGLAYWFMDDGGKTYYTNKSKGVEFHTGGFTIEEVKNMSKELNEKFDLHSWQAFNREYPIIRIPANLFFRFISLVDPYIHPHMKYKLSK